MSEIGGGKRGGVGRKDYRLEEGGEGLHVWTGG